MAAATEYRFPGVSPARLSNTRATNSRFIHTGGILSMEQMEQLLPRTAKDHFCKSRKSNEIFGAVKGVG